MVRNRNEIKEEEKSFVERIAISLEGIQESLKSMKQTLDYWYYLEQNKKR